MKTVNLAVWAISLIFLYDFTLFVIDMHQIMLISLFSTSFDHFHYHGFLKSKRMVILKSCHIYSHLTITAVFHPVHWLNSNIFFIIIIWYNWVVTTTSHPIGKVSESDGVWFRRILGTLFDEPYYTQSTKSRMNGKLENDPLITSFILICLTFHHSAEKLVKSFSP